MQHPERLRQPHPSQEAEGPYHAGGDAASQNAKSTIRSRIEHVFAEQKERMDLFIRTVGIARATTKIGLANLVYNIKRLIFLAAAGYASAAGRGASIFKMADHSRHRSMDALRGYVRDGEICRNHAGDGLL
jgi:hypothetical protein